ncbi:GINS complex subunit [Globomyces sp. JEL0801]|nr:GINS complex subunit [Globomyces sp. JEL0801]
MLAEIEAIVGTLDDDYEQLPEDIDTVSLMLTAWQNELHAPELLEYKHNLVESLTEKIQSQTELVESNITERQQDPFVLFILQQEIERIKYMIRSYLRCRMEKVIELDLVEYQLEKYTQFLLIEREERFKLSKHELEYCTRFHEILSRYHSESFLKNLPPQLQSLTEDEMISRPNLKDGVFCKVLEEVGQILLDNQQETVQLSKGDIFLICYDNVRNLVNDNKVMLI